MKRLFREFNIVALIMLSVIFLGCSNQDFVIGDTNCSVSNVKYLDTLKGLQGDNLIAGKNKKYVSIEYEVYESESYQTDYNQIHNPDATLIDDKGNNFKLLAIGTTIYGSRTITWSNEKPKIPLLGKILYFGPIPKSDTKFTLSIYSQEIKIIK